MNSKLFSFSEEEYYNAIKSYLIKIINKITDDLHGPIFTNIIIHKVIFKNNKDKLMVYITKNENEGYHCHIYLETDLLINNNLKLIELIGRFIKDFFRELLIFEFKHFYPGNIERLINMLCYSYLARIKGAKFNYEYINAEDRTKLLWTKNIPNNLAFESEFIKEILDPYQFEKLYNFSGNLNEVFQSEQRSAGLISTNNVFDYFNNGDKSEIDLDWI